MIENIKDFILLSTDFIHQTLQVDYKGKSVLESVGRTRKCLRRTGYLDRIFGQDIWTGYLDRITVNSCSFQVPGCLEQSRTECQINNPVLVYKKNEFFDENNEQNGILNILFIISNMLYLISQCFLVVKIIIALNMG